MPRNPGLKDRIPLGFALTGRKLWVLLSLGERVGVRGNGPHSNPKCRAVAGTVKLQESCGSAAGFPPGVSKLRHSRRLEMGDGSKPCGARAVAGRQTPCEQCVSCDRPLPLTPALSLGERENPSPTRDEPEHTESLRARTMRFPLLGAEHYPHLSLQFRPIPSGFHLSAQGWTAGAKGRAVLPWEKRPQHPPTLKGLQRLAPVVNTIAATLSGLTNPATTNPG